MLPGRKQKGADTIKYKDVLAFARNLLKNQTPAEAFFWQQVRNRQLLGKKFIRQFVIQHAVANGDKKFFIADFYCHEHQLIVEVDGSIHEQQVEYDEIRQKILAEIGFRVIRFTNKEVLTNWEKVRRELQSILVDSPPAPLSPEKGDH